MKKVSVERLTGRLGLRKYDVPAPLTEPIHTNTVKILLDQHLGAPALPCVAVGDTVERGDVIAKASETALSVNIHASIAGKVAAVTPKYIKITR
jgi:Na+-translocating ferredoxin:NAD+ oxidoreductase RnfC subunit